MTAHLAFRAQRGLSLLELLVAFAIMAMALGMLYRSMGSSARNVAEMVYQQQAAMVAESLLSARESVSAEGWTESGESAGFTWQVKSEPYLQEIRRETGPSGGTPITATKLHLVLITVRWFDGSRTQAFEMQTLLPQRRQDPGEVSR